MKSHRRFIYFFACLAVALSAENITAADSPAAASEISGKFSIDRVGAATYSIPLQLPPGTAGVAPQLALQYDSHAADGTTGVGWSLTGFSSITRCAVRRDGHNYPVEYDGDDRFCLDGAYMVAAPGSRYGADGATYYLEKQPWVRAHSYGQCPSEAGGPCRFVVEQPSGERFEYGVTDNSAIEVVPDDSAKKNFPLGAIRVWALARQTDRNGNSIEYEYEENTSTGEYLPAVVRYTGNTLASTPLTPQRAVSFRYDDTTPIYRYQGGAKVVQSKRLQRIESCIAPGGVDRCNTNTPDLQQVSFYVLDYKPSPATGRDLLTTITQGGADGSTLPSQSFDYYSPENNAYSAPEAWTNEFTWDHGWSNSTSQQRTLADVDGDGRYDLIGFGQSVTQYALSDGTKFLPAASQKMYSYQQGYTNNSRYPRLITDVNGDGRSDIIGFGNSAVQVSRSLGDKFEEPQKWSGEMTYSNGGWDNSQNIRSAADINGDGRSDIIGFGNSKLVFQLSTGDGFTDAVSISGFFTTNAGYTTPATHPRFMADVNGDGRADIVGFKSGGEIQVGLSTGEGFVDAQTWTDAFIPDSSAGWIPGQNPRFVMDMNGDGRADLIGFRNRDVIVAFSTGRSFAAPIPWTTAFTYENGGWNDTKGTLRTLGDVNGDRQPDIIGFGNNDTSFGINTLTGFDTERFAPIKDAFGYASIARNPRFPADSIGNGISALIGLGNNSVIVSQPPMPKPDLIKTLVNELRGSVAVEYASTADGTAVYTPSQTRWDYPYRTRTGPMDIVSKHTLSDGMGDSYVYTHAYRGAVADLQERGFLGFESVTLTDLQLNPNAPQPGVETTTQYTIPFPRTGLAQAVESVVLDSGKTVTRMEYDYQPFEIHPGVFDVRKLSENGFHYNLANALSYQTRQTYEYDDFGNLQLLTDFGNIDDDSDDSAACVNFWNDTDLWMIGFPLNSATGPGGTVNDGVCTSENAITRDRWTYTDDVRRNTATHAQYDNTNNGWLGTAMSWDEYGNIHIDSGAYWTTADGSGAPTTFNPLTTTYDSDYRTFPVHTANLLFTTQDRYDARFGTQTSHTDPNGVETTSRYDAFGRIASTSGPSPQGQTVELANWRYSEQDAGVLITQTQLVDWGGMTAWTREYHDGLSRLYRKQNQSTQGCAITLDQHYVAVDRIDKTSLPYYTASGEQNCARTAQPVYVIQRYDPLGRVYETERPDGAITHYAPDMAVLQGITRDRVMQTDAYGSPEARTYSTYLDPTGRTLRWVFPRQDGADADPITDLKYDALGRMTQLTAPNGIASHWTLDSLGRTSIKSSTSSGEQRSRFGPQGMLVEETNAEGKRVTWRYDSIGRVLTETLHNSDTDSNTTTFNYDQPEYSYAIGRLTSVLNPDGRMEHHYNYDPYGNRQESKLSIDGFQFAIQIDYDPLQRAVLLTYPDGAKQQKQYAIDSFLSDVSVCLDDAACKGGQFTSYADFSEYTALGEPKRTAYKNGATSVTNYQYDVVGRILSYDTTSGQSTALIDQTFDWDRLDQLLTSTDKLDELRSLAYRYDGAGYLKSSAIGSRQTEYRYDAIGNLKQKGDIVFQTEGAQVLSGTRNGEEVFSAAYDSAGNMINRHRTGSDGVKHQWRQSYDALNRMTAISSESKDTASETQVAGFTYDYNNNLVKRIDTAAGVTSYYISKNYDVSVMDDSSVVYTKYVDGINSPVAAISTGNSSLAGQLPPAPTDRWEALGQAEAGGTGAISLTTIAGLSLMLVTLFTGILSISMPQGMDLSRLLGRHIKLGLYLLLITSVAIPRVPLAAASATLEPGINGPGIPVEGKILFFHSDQVRSTILVTDQDGMPQAELLYGPYGEIDESTSFGKDNFRAKFAGTELAEGIGLYLNAGRFYEPMTGRFVTADNYTIGSATNNAVQFNRYAYAANNPITHTDPTGNSASSVLFDIGLVAAAVASVAVGGGVVAVAELGAYFGGSAVNHSYDPANWNFKSWKTYGGMAAGIAVSEVGLAISIAAPEAIPEEAGAFAVFLAGVAADAAVGFAENATYAALGGASRDEILKQGLIGMATGAGFSAAGQGLSAGISRVASRSATRAAEAGEETATLGSRVGTATEKEGGGLELESMSVCSSFESGTMVITTDGPKPIEQMELGDWVMAFDADKGSTEPRQVTAGYRRTANQTVTLTTTSGDTVVATVEHPFLRDDGQWIDAAALQPGDRLQTAGAEPITLAVVSLEEKRTTVHNISVEGLHTYLIESDKWIVHNPNHGCTSKNAAELRKNMKSQSGRSAEPDFSHSAHHIVESTDPSPYMRQARDHLDKMGIDINRSTNGIYLARSSAVQKTIVKGKWRNAYPHSRVHTKLYKEHVWNSIRHTKTRRETLRELRNLKRQLRKGKLPQGTVRWP